ncbi:spermatogenesis-associated protein 25 [Malaclemys terrapin pileata]|uniref:spermatogenesis-associated protein 25 n=1 Tax=Malaclemys terrapin pileata TaxID=2991368 RepID=UPI0023A87DA9|nr:spermatogenesis-associated protein 25 [Malaclemys terrapin pileata]
MGRGQCWYIMGRRGTSPIPTLAMSYFGKEKASSGFLTSIQDASRQLQVAKSNLLSVYQCGETSLPAGVLVPGVLRRKTQEIAAPSHVEATLVYQEKTLKQPCSGAQQSPRFPLSSRSGYRDIRWEPYSGHYCGRYSRKFPQHKQDEISIWDYPSEWVRDKQPCGPSGMYPSASVKGYPPTQQRNGQHVGELGSPGGDFPLATCGFPPRGAFLMPIKLSKNRGRQSVQNPPPNICILTLAMMIAGIPTVPVPGIKEEDLIRAAQNFMAENPEQGVQREITPKRTEDAQFWKTDRQRKRPVDRGFQPPSIAHFEK